MSIGPLAKTKIEKMWVFCCTVYTARNTHNFSVFGKKSACVKKTESHFVFLVSGAHARLLVAFDRSASWVIPHKVTSHVTKNLNNTGERGASVYIGEKKLKNRRSFKNHTSEVGFRFVFFAVFRGRCLATSNEKLECEINSGSFYASVNGSCDNLIWFRFKYFWAILRV